MTFDLKAYLQQYSESLTVVGPFYHGITATIHEPVVYVDKGVEFRTDVVCGISVGDNDSTNIPLDVVLPVDKDFSDLRYVLNSIPKPFKMISLLGFLGGRQDHNLINFGEVNLFLKDRESTVVSFDQEIIAVNSKYTFKYNGTFSLVSFIPQEISISGDARYTGEFEVEVASSQCLSNMAQGEICISPQTTVFIFLN